MRIDAEEENSGAGEGALYAEADVVAEVRSVYTNSPRSWCLRRPYHPAYRTASTCQHWLWTRTAGTREDMGPRLPKAALPTCKAHGALGEQALSPVAFTHHSLELERDPARRRVRTRPLLVLVLRSLFGSVDLPAFPLLHGFAHPHTPNPKRPSSSPSPGRADPSATQIHPPPMGSVKVLPPPPAARSADL
jgi:hypothetical protein